MTGPLVGMGSAGSYEDASKYHIVEESATLTPESIIGKAQTGELDGFDLLNAVGQAAIAAGEDSIVYRRHAADWDVYVQLVPGQFILTSSGKLEKVVKHPAEEIAAVIPHILYERSDEDGIALKFSVWVTNPDEGLVLEEIDGCSATVGTKNVIDDLRREAECVAQTIEDHTGNLDTFLSRSADIISKLRTVGANKEADKQETSKGRLIKFYLTEYSDLENESPEDITDAIFALDKISQERWQSIHNTWAENIAETDLLENSRLAFVLAEALARVKDPSFDDKATPDQGLAISDELKKLVLKGRAIINANSTMGLPYEKNPWAGADVLD